MDYTLQKLIVPAPTHYQPKRFLRSDPAKDYVNPGIGGAIQMFSFHVPLYSNKSLLQKQKLISNEQEGSGEIENRNEQEQSSMREEIPVTVKPIETKTKDDTDNIIVNQSVDHKLDPQIKESFLHPKIKIGKVQFDATVRSPLQKNKKQTIVKSEKPSQKVTSHKFQFFD